MSTPLSFVLDTREQLLNALAEAAEIEHNLMCCYLYAAFSLKEGLDEGLSVDELAAVKRWRQELIHVAVGEMTHLALVANLMSAIGGVPNFRRSNFPISPGNHPSGIVVKLAPFALETLDHFIYLERPEDAGVRDGVGFEPNQRFNRSPSPGRLCPTNGDYETVGGLYRAIADGLASYTEARGADALFIGDPALQLGAEVSNLPGLIRVRCLETACTALKRIVIDGEGSDRNSETSHFQRFTTIRGEVATLCASRSGFEPARPAAHNPVMRAPPAPEGRVWITAAPAADLLDLANAVYVHMLRLLLQAYGENRGLPVQRAFASAAAELMFAITPVASALTRLPARAGMSAPTAGMTFAVPQQSSALPAGAYVDRVLLERLDEIVARANGVVVDSVELSPVAARIARIRDKLAGALGISSAAATPSRAVAVPFAIEAQPSAREPASGFEAIAGSSLTILYSNERCIHARHCVLEQPAAFKANVPGKWIDPDAVSVEGLLTLAHMCPSGAIRYSRHDGGQEEQSPPINLIQVRENGPLGFRAELYIDGTSIGYRATLCRCGASQHKPFCDNSHLAVDFRATGEPSKLDSQPLNARNGRLEVAPQPNGPLLVEGNVELCSGTGRTFERNTSVRLCRCGSSENKPFCDGSHAKVGFQAE